MNLYRIDLTRTTDGSALGTVSDILGPVLIRAWKDARAAAIDAAACPGTDAHITRISGAGRMRRVGFVVSGSDTVTRVSDRYLPGRG